MDLEARIKFCEEQIEKFSDLYATLVSQQLLEITGETDVVEVKKYKTKKEEKANKSVDKDKNKSKSKSKSKNKGKSKNGNEKETEIDEILNFLDTAATTDDTKVKVKSEAKKSIDKSDAEELLNYLESAVEEPKPQNVRKTQETTKMDEYEDEHDTRKLIQIHKDRQAVLQEFEDRRLMIVAEEKKLIESGVHENDAREIMRRKYYPDSIPKHQYSAEDVRIERLKLTEMGYTPEQIDEKIKIMYPDYMVSKIADVAVDNDDDIDPDDILDEVIVSHEDQ